MARPCLNLLRLRSQPIFYQLQLEEALYRLDKGNWLLLNDGSSVPSVVLGISGKPQALLHIDLVLEQQLPVVRRYTGGGTVVVDKDTVFSSFIVQGEVLPHVEPYPQPIMRWSSQCYQHVFNKHSDFNLKENDYAFQERKFGGNAQAISRNRWVHHTSFLWDYDPRLMSNLKQPERAPQYRQGRSHESFLVRLKDVLTSRGMFLEGIVEAAQIEGFDIREKTLADVEPLLQREHLRTTRQLDPQELRAMLLSTAV